MLNKIWSFILSLFSSGISLKYSKVHRGNKIVQKNISVGGNFIQNINNDYHGEENKINERHKN